MYSAAVEIDRTHRDAPIEVTAGHGPPKTCARYMNPLNAQVLDALRIRAAFGAGELAIDEDFDVGKSS